MMVTKLLKQQTMMRCYSVMLVLSLCVSLFAGCANDNQQEQVTGSYPTTAGTIITAVYDGVLYLADPSGNIHTTSFGHGFIRQQTSFDGTKMLGRDEDGRVVYFDGTELKLITDDANSAVMSADGSVIVYGIPGNGDRVSDLYRYADGKSTYIASGFILNTVVSPDGSAVGYTMVSDSGTYDSYYWDGSGEVKLVGYEKRLFGISNNAELIYYNKYRESDHTPESLWVQSGSSDSFTQTCLAAHKASTTRVSFNRDGTEVLFWGDGYSCISVRGGEPIRICEKEVGLMSPAGTQESVDGTHVYFNLNTLAGNFFCPHPKYDETEPTYPVMYVGEDYTVYTVFDYLVDDIYLCNDRKTCFYEVDNALYRFDGSEPQEEPVKLFDGNDFLITNNGSVILFSNDNLLYKANGTKSTEQTVQIQTFESGAGQLSNLAATSDGNEILYSCEYGRRAYYQSGKKQSAKIDAYGSVSVMEFKDSLYCCYQGSLYRMEDGEPIRIEGLESCNYILADQHMIIVFADRSTYGFSYEVQNTYTPITHYWIDYAGCYFSVDGVNFMPLVENYIAEEN